jgi:2,4-dienoyl-CoA reductase-like NADH-dependent reductase (Old Yellow Enzyme family)
VTTTSPAPTLFGPVEIAGRTLRNRVVMAPMTRQFSPGGMPTEAVGDYYVRRADGGAGTLITEGLAIDEPGSVHDDAIPHFHGAAALDAWSRITQRVHAAGAAFVPQLWHVGGYLGTLTGRPGHEAAVSPSGQYWPGVRYGEPASQEDIDRVVAAYGDAAAAAFAMGCDGLDIHAGHGYLVDQFLWAETNHREDAYGGDLAGRTRFATEVIAECRRRTGPDFALFFRFSQWKLQDYSARLFADPAELGTFLDLLVAAGVDVFDCSTRRFWTPEFEGSELSLAGWTRRLSGRATMAVGSVGLDNDVVASLHGQEQTSGVSGLDRLDGMVRRGECDLVGVGRALLADADWTRKVEAGDLSSLRGFTRDDLEFLT